MHDLEDKVHGKTKLKFKVSYSSIHSNATLFAQKKRTLPDHIYFRNQNYNSTTEFFFQNNLKEIVQDSINVDKALLIKGQRKHSYAIF